MSRFHARSASGFYRDENGKLLLPSANRCLEVLVGDDGSLDVRIMRPYNFLFGGMGARFTLSIPASRIVSVEKTSYRRIWDTVQITFESDNNSRSCLELAFTAAWPEFGPGKRVRRNLFFDSLTAGHSQ